MPDDLVIIEEETQAIAAQNISPIMMLADKLALGLITADQMEKMLDVQMKWEKHEAMKAYHVAMAKFQENAPSIIKSKQGHNCMHADLAIDIVAVVAPKLSEQGLSHKWITESVDKGVKVTCQITHVQGYSESTSMVAGPDTSGSKNAIQAIGSTVTYLQRYTLKAALGLAEGGQGDDGNGGPDIPQEIEPPTEAQLKVVDAIIELLVPPDGYYIDRMEVAGFFLRTRGRYPSDMAQTHPASEHVVKSGTQIIYKKKENTL
jgi:hypothetical protein